MSLNTKNILRNIGFLLSIPVIIMAFVFAVSEDRCSNVQAIEVDILNPELGFVSKKDVEYALKNENIILDHSTIEHLDVAALEQKINSNPWVKHAEVFVTSTQSVKVRLKQVEPHLRVQRTDSSANGYYIGSQGEMIPLSKNYAADLPILTAERTVKTKEQRKKLVRLAQFIERDTFWHATISQINLDRNNDIELISLIGDANIRFGSMDNMEDKFFRLFQFYKKGINRINWANVKELDLRFDKQLVCRRYHKEKHIEQLRAPSLYVKKKTAPVASNKESKLNLRKAKTEISMAKLDVPKRRKVEVKKTTDRKEIAKKATTNLEKIRVKKVVVKKIATPVKVESKPAVVKKVEKKVEAKVETKAVQPKPKRKKKREIIINTEPVTKK